MDVANLLIANEIIRNLNDAEEDAEEDRQLLQIKNPFTLTDRGFVKRFRVNKRLAQDIIDLVTPFMQAPIRRSGMTIERKVLSALRFLGFGSYQEITGSNSYVAVSQPSVSRALREFCDAMNQNEIFQQWVHFPRNIQEMQHLRNRFFEKYQLPGAIGCVDCTHVAIVRPSNNDPLHPEHIYVNRKSYHSVNVQLICDEELRIMNVNARFPGSSHDSHIWRESAVSRLMEQVYRRDNENPCFLLGDSGYPLRPWLMTPLENPPIPNTPDDRFNQAILSARSTIERCNGVLKNRFRCLLKHRFLHYTPTMAGKIINTCVVLHNMCLHYDVPEPQFDCEAINADFGMNIPQLYVAEDNNQVENENANGRRANPDLIAGRRLQNRIAQIHFNNV